MFIRYLSVNTNIRTTQIIKDSQMQSKLRAMHPVATYEIVQFFRSYPEMTESDIVPMPTR